MSRFKVYIEYDGTRYSGWQVQKNARTIQGELLEAAKHVFETDEVEFYGSGRTDAGVHALRQVAHLDVNTMLAPEIIRKKLNDVLPTDINILEVEKVDKNFHARHDAVLRSYLYLISKRRTAFGKRYVWWVKKPLDVNAMKEAAKLFVGMKDLQLFTSNDPDEKSTKVKIENIVINEVDDLILIRVEGSHFLWNLVRRIIGVLVEVGHNNLSLKQVEDFITAESDKPPHYTAPPSGLFLERVYYEGDKRVTALGREQSIVNIFQEKPKIRGN